MSLFPSGPPSPMLRATPALLTIGLMALLGSGAALSAQTQPVRVEENFRAEPNGTVLGQLSPGTLVQVVGTEGNWSRITVEGFVWTPSLQSRSGGGFDLLVIEPGGENLREEPSGRIAGRLSNGTLLEEVERRTGWIRVRRTGWIWTASLDAAPGGGSAATPAIPSVPSSTASGGGAPAPTSSASTTATASTPASPSSAPPGGDGLGWIRGGAQGAPILAAPDGDTLGRIGGGTELRVLAREGNWARVQMEGWVWVPALEAPLAGAPPEAGTVLEGVSPRELAADPERYRGRLVSIQVQFISIERAELVRTDFYEGEPFLLTRSQDGDRSFIYIAIPPDRVQELSALTPLEGISIVGRVRSGAAALTGSPILDLVDLRRTR